MEVRLPGPRSRWSTDASHSRRGRCCVSPQDGCSQVRSSLSYLLYLKLTPASLRKSDHGLRALREKLFLLWGSLEERTVERHLRQKQKQDCPSAVPGQNQPRKRVRNSRNSSSKRHKYDELGKPLKGGNTDPDSDTEETAEEEAEEEQHGGKMFEACVKEYGTPDGDGWKRLHKLFGTVIM